MPKKSAPIGTRALCSTFAASILALVLVSDSAKATLITYEGFDYGNFLAQDQSVLGITGGLGADPNQGNAFGWGANWSTSQGTNQFMTGSLSYASGGVLLTDGGALRVGGVHPMVGNTTAQLQRQLAFDLGGGSTPNTLGGIAANYGGTLWVSFLYQNWVDDPLDLPTPGYASAYLAFIQSSTTNVNGSSDRNGQDIFGVGAGNSSTAGVPLGTIVGGIGANNGLVSIDPNAYTSWGPNSEATLFVLRIEFDTVGTNDTISLWENPVIGSGEGGLGAATVTYSTNLSTVNGFRWQAGNNNASRTNAVMVVDEFRLGSTFDSVTPLIPEPSFVAIVGLGLGGLFMAMRRRRS